MYESPIEAIYEGVQMKFEDEVLKAVEHVGINVDKDELIKALQYDRGQYKKGYADRDAEIIRCKDCKHRDAETGLCEGRGWPMQLVPDDGFCDKGERGEE